MSMHRGRDKLRRRWKRWCAGLMAAALVTPVLAHHSGAMFDDKVALTLNGTVKQFQWTNPHCWIQVLVASASGPVEWSVEMGSPSQLFRGGWKPKTVHVGDKIVVIVHPMRDGTNGGLLVSAAHADGTPFAVAAK